MKDWKDESIYVFRKSNHKNHRFVYNVLLLFFFIFYFFEDMKRVIIKIFKVSKGLARLENLDRFSEILIKIYFKYISRGFKCIFQRKSIEDSNRIETEAGIHLWYA